MTARLRALMALRVQGVATLERLAAALGTTEQDAQETAEALVATQTAQSRTLGRISGWSLTDEGTTALDAALDAEGARSDDALRDLYDRFVPLDARLKQICYAWQIRKHGPIEQPNDHNDPDYDQSVIDRLREHHDGVTALVRRAVERAPRLAVYQMRLDACVEKLLSGDRQSFTGALCESYHQVWFELHEDLILTLGLTREE